MVVPSWSTLQAILNNQFRWREDGVTSESKIFHSICSQKDGLRFEGDGGTASLQTSLRGHLSKAPTPLSALL